MKKFGNLNISTKLTALLSISFIFLSLLIFIGWTGMQEMKNSSRKIYDETFLESQRFMNLTIAIEDVRRTLLTLMIESDKDKLEANLQAITDKTEVIDGHIAFMLSKNNHFDKEAINSIKKLKSIWTLFKTTRDEEVLPAIFEGRLDAAKQIAINIQEQRYRKIIDISDMLVKHENAEAVAAQNLMEQRFNRVILYYLIVICVAVVIAISFTIYISKDIVGRIKKIEHVVTVYDHGKKNATIEVGGNDEIAVLAKSFNNMSRRILEDRVNQKQYAQILEWNADKMDKRAEELQEVNKALSKTQEELSNKYKEQEAFIKELTDTHLELEETRAHMVQSEKMASIGQLAAGVAHEINNPIGFIRSNLNTLEEYTEDLVELLKLYTEIDKPLKDGSFDCDKVLHGINAFKNEKDTDFTILDIKNLVEESKEGVNRVVSIVKSLKDFSHADVGGQKKCDLNQCIEDTIKVSWHEIKYKAEVIRELGELPPVICNHQQINQVLLNIIINASQAIEEKGQITIKTFTDNEYAVVKITDNGTGMSEENVKKIFDPFFTTKPIGKGTGLGLSIAHGVIEKHRGSIEVQSKEGEGTTFTVKLPVKGADAFDAANTEPLQTGERGAC